MSAPTLASLVRSYIAQDSQDLLNTEIPSQIAHGFDTGAWRLVLVVKELGEVLVSDDDALRSKGVALLSSVVQKMDKAKLDRQSTQTLTTFFVGKLDDNSSLTYSLHGLTGLTQSPAFGSGEGAQVAKGLFAHVKPQSHPQSVRFLVYSLIDALMSRSRPALVRLGKEFIKGYCALVEGEKDPRNLMLSFGIIHVILVEFDLTDCVEDLFDITFCYFPITFTPPPDDPYGISSDDLVIALRTCLAATPLFGPLALPLFLDKMQAASEKSKRQTLQAVAACFPIYGAQVSGEGAARFAEALTVEVFHATDTGLQDLALVAIRSLFATLYPDTPQLHQITHSKEDGDVDMLLPENEKVAGVAVKVVDNSLEELAEPDKSNAKPAAQVLTALMSASHRLSHYVLNRTLPQLLATFKDPDEAALKPAILGHLATLVAGLGPKAPSSPTAAAPLVHSPPHSPLDPFRDDLLAAFTSGSRQPATRPAALPGLVHLVEVPAFLTAEEVSYSVSALNDVLVAPDSDDEYDAALDGLVAVAELHPRVVEGSTLPLLFALLPSGEVPSRGSRESDAYRRALEALASLCTHPDLFEILVLRVLARLEGVCATSATDKEERATAGLYAHHLLATVRAVIKAKVGKKHGDVGRYVERFVPRVYGVFVLPTTVAGGEGVVANDARLVEDAAEVIKLVVQQVKPEQQAQFSTALQALFDQGQLEPLLGEQAKQAGSIAFTPWANESSPAQKDLIPLYAAGLLPVGPAATPLAPAQLQPLVSAFLARYDAAHAAQLTAPRLNAVGQLLGAGVNKRGPELAHLIDSELPAFWDEVVANAAVGVATRAVGLRVWSWVARGLVVRSDQRGYGMVEKVLGLMEGEKGRLAREGATSLGLIVDERDGVFSKENKAVVRLLYKQRFFGFLLPKLVAGHKAAAAAGQDGQAVYLVALSSLLQHIPRQMTLAELPKLLPLLITALDLADPALRANVIDTLALLAREVPDEMSEHIVGLVQKVLKALVADTKGVSRESVKLRLASLEFLGALPGTMPWSVLQGQKATVVKELGKVVDDGRREVRRKAVECRSRWFLFSS